MKFFFCEKCGKRVTDSDVAAGQARDKKLRGVFCTDCAAGVLTLETMPITEDQAQKILQDQPSAGRSKKESGAAIASARASRIRESQEPPRPVSPFGPGLLVLSLGAVVLGIGISAVVWVSRGEKKASPDPTQPQSPAPVLPVLEATTSDASEAPVRDHTAPPVATDSVKEPPATKAPVPPAAQAHSAENNERRAAYDQVLARLKELASDRAARIAAAQPFLERYPQSLEASRLNVWLKQRDEEEASLVPLGNVPQEAPAADAAIWKQLRRFEISPDGQKLYFGGSREGYVCFDASGRYLATGQPGDNGKNPIELLPLDQGERKGWFVGVISYAHAQLALFKPNGAIERTLVKVTRNDSGLRGDPDWNSLGNGTVDTSRQWLFAIDRATSREFAFSRIAIFDLAGAYVGQIARWSKDEPQSLERDKLTYADLEVDPARQILYAITYVHPHKRSLHRLRAFRYDEAKRGELIAEVQADAAVAVFPDGRVATLAFDLKHVLIFPPELAGEPRKLSIPGVFSAAKVYEAGKVDFEVDAQGRLYLGSDLPDVLFVRWSADFEKVEYASATAQATPVAGGEIAAQSSSGSSAAVPAAPETPPPPPPDPYAIFQKHFMAALFGGMRGETARLLQSAALEIVKAAGDRLALDRRAAGWLAELDAAVWSGAAKLAEQERFELRLNQGKPVWLGRSAEFKVLKLDPDALWFGSKGLQLSVKRADLHPSTQWRLAELGLPSDGAGQVRRIFARMLAEHADERMLSAKEVEDAAARAEKAGAAAEDLAALRHICAFQSGSKLEREAEAIIARVRLAEARKDWMSVRADAETLKTEYRETKAFADIEEWLDMTLDRGASAPALASEISRNLALWVNFDGMKIGSVILRDASESGHSVRLGHDEVKPKLVVEGLIQKSMQFDGKQRIVVNDHPDLRFSEAQSFTVAAWAKPDWPVQGDYQAVVNKAEESKKNYGLWIGPGPTWYFAGESLVGGAVTGEWQHVALVQDAASGTRTAYLNGVKVAEGKAIECSGHGELNIGWSSKGTNYKGMVDDVRIYRSALSPEQIVQLVKLVRP
ncbi:MAG: hypothetical protein HS116_05435 [Planctomycetes bacterium]|nr:hypothetical protein [Planctomycetota bacterium]